MPSPYQQQVNALTGALGPTRGAYWDPTMTTSGNPWSLGAQPMEYNTALGKYVTAYSAPAAQGSMSFNFGNRRRFGKWAPPRSLKRRRSHLNRCGSKCYLKPNPKKPGFPVCTGGCRISREGLMAAKRRAAQNGHRNVERKADQLLKKYFKGGKKRSKRKGRRSKRKRSKRKGGRRKKKRSYRRYGSRRSYRRYGSRRRGSYLKRTNRTSADFLNAATGNMMEGVINPMNDAANNLNVLNI